jgi:DNA-binding MarR family transcriptional regulator
VAAQWSFLTNHGQVLLCIARDPHIRLRDIAVTVGITERRAHGIVTDLTRAGYVEREKDGRRNRYMINTELPIPDPTIADLAIGNVIDLLVRDGTSR